jgi:hypothetical protein
MKRERTGPDHPSRGTLLRLPATGRTESEFVSGQSSVECFRDGDYAVIIFLRNDMPSNALSAGEPCWIRTSDLLIKSQLLYRLS